MKYEFTDETCEHNGHTLKRIKRCSDGFIGGWIEGRHNLSENGSCFVYGEAKVYENATITGDAEISWDAEVYEKAFVTDFAQICDNAKVHGNSFIKNKVIIKDHAEVYGSALIAGSARIMYHGKVHGNAVINGSSCVEGYSEIFDGAILHDRVCVKGKAKVGGNLRVDGTTVLLGDTVFTERGDYIHLSGLRYPVTIQKGGLATIGCTTKTVEKWLNYSYGCARAHVYYEEYEMMKSLLTPLLERFKGC